MIKKRLLIVALILLVISTVFIYSNPIVGKFITGTARIIENEIKCELYIDGKLIPEAKLFISESNFDKTQKRNNLILYLRESESSLNFPILVIDRNNCEVYLPNSSKKDYDIICGKLLQSDSGANVNVALSNQSKGFAFDPKLKIENNRISFKFPNRSKVYEIIINIA